MEGDKLFLLSRGPNKTVIPQALARGITILFGPRGSKNSLSPDH